MRGVSIILAVTIMAVLAPSGAAAKSAVSRAQSKYTHQTPAAERTKLATPTATTSPVAKAATRPALTAGYAIEIVVKSMNQL